MQALEELSNALYTLVKSYSLKYVKAEIIKRTVLANLMYSLAPIAWLKIGQVSFLRLLLPIFLTSPPRSSTTPG